MNAREAAERAAARWVDENGRGSLCGIIMSEFAPLLAAKDAEIAGLIREAADIMEERDRLAAENAELRRELASR